MSIKVYKFGGASIANPKRMESLRDLLQSDSRSKIVIVISAMGKTTNGLELVWKAFMKNSKEGNKLLGRQINAHLAVAKKLGLSVKVLEKKFLKLAQEQIELVSKKDHERSYDQLISLGELYSTTIINELLVASGIESSFLDVRSVMHTDSTYREAKVDLKHFVKDAKKQISKMLKKNRIIVTQGFIGKDHKGYTTTLGREGSDYTAALIAYALEVDELTIWKDVEGILTGDPSRFDNVEKINKLSYREAIEMTYYGAKVIHPKTIQPIQNKGIKLNVRSFLKPKVKGTLISDKSQSSYPPIVVIQDEVSLLEIVRNDFSFIAEEHLSLIFSQLNKYRIKVCTMRNSAISFNLCVSKVEPSRLKGFIKSLGKEFQIDIVTDLQLITVRHYQDNIVQRLTKNKTILFEEKLDDTIQLVVKESLAEKR